MGERSKVKARGHALARQLGVVVVAGTLLTATACTSDPDAKPSQTPAASTREATRQRTANCAAEDRTLPSWASDYANLAGAKLVSDHTEVVAILFTPPLRATKSDEASNKILWVVKEPRGQAPLHIKGQQISSGKTFQVSQAADADPDNIYPTIVDAPEPGCWRIVLDWGNHTDTLQLDYEA